MPKRARELPYNAHRRTQRAIADEETYPHASPDFDAAVGPSVARSTDSLAVKLIDLELDRSFHFGVLSLKLLCVFPGAFDPATDRAGQNPEHSRDGCLGHSFGMHLNGSVQLGLGASHAVIDGSGVDGESATAVFAESAVPTDVASLEHAMKDDASGQSELARAALRVWAARRKFGVRLHAIVSECDSLDLVRILERAFD